jgi:hypothetical protein
MQTLEDNINNIVKSNNFHIHQIKNLLKNTSKENEKLKKGIDSLISFVQKLITQSSETNLNNNNYVKQLEEIYGFLTNDKYTYKSNEANADEATKIKILLREIKKCIHYIDIGIDSSKMIHDNDNNDDKNIGIDSKKFQYDKEDNNNEIKIDSSTKMNNANKTKKNTRIPYWNRVKLINNANNILKKEQPIKKGVNKLINYITRKNGGKIKKKKTRRRRRSHRRTYSSHR